MSRLDAWRSARGPQRALLTGTCGEVTVRTEASAAGWRRRSVRWKSGGDCPASAGSLCWPCGVESGGPQLRVPALMTPRGALRRARGSVGAQHTLPLRPRA